MPSNQTNAKQRKASNFIYQKIKQLPFRKYAKVSGFSKRKSQKITAKSLLLSFFFMAVQGNNSFQLWAVQLNNLAGTTVSKQAIWKRITPCLVVFLKLILTDALLQQVNATQQKIKQGLIKISDYQRVLIQDSTVIALPWWLVKYYPGNTSRGRRKSQLKIQVIYDLISNTFIYFEVTAFTENDQSKAKDILNIARKGDLVIRDLGYFSIDCFSKLNDIASFVSRVKYGVKIYDCKSGIEINLLKYLRKNNRFDQFVIIGTAKKVKVRLVVMPLQEEQANQKRCRAKSDRDKRKNHSQEYYELLGYCIFITTESKAKFSANQIAKLYGLRWRIESIFKCWKSQFKLQELIPKSCALNKVRVESIIYMMLIFIVLFQVAVYNYMVIKAEQKQNCSISLIKLCQFISNNIAKFFEKSLDKLEDGILYYCVYEQRNDRENYAAKLMFS